MMQSCRTDRALPRGLPGCTRPPGRTPEAGAGWLRTPAPARACCCRGSGPGCWGHRRGEDIQVRGLVRKRRPPAQPLGPRTGQMRMCMGRWVPPGAAWPGSGQRASPPQQGLRGAQGEVEPRLGEASGSGDSPASHEEVGRQLWGHGRREAHLQQRGGPQEGVPGGWPGGSQPESR